MRDTLIRNRVAGAHPRLARNEVSAVVRGVIAGDVSYTFGLDVDERFRHDAAAVSVALARTWGWSPDDPGRVRIDPDCTIAGATTAWARVGAVARAGGRIAFATTRPASMLDPFVRIARAAESAGAMVCTDSYGGPFSERGRHALALTWIGAVAVATDGVDLVRTRGEGAGAEFLYSVGHPDVVVADGGFAAHALADGIETVVVADLDGAVFGLLARDDVHVVPVVTDRRSCDYDPIVDLAQLHIDGRDAHVDSHDRAS